MVEPAGIQSVVEVCEVFIEMDESLIKKFIDRATEQNAEVLTVDSGLVAATVGKVARESGLRTFSVSEGLSQSVKDALKDAGLSDSEPPADIAVTGAAWAVAETGTLVVRGSRRRFITSEVHVAVVEGSRMLANLEDIPFFGENSPFLTLVTGPSRTADIERILVLGAHGPRRLVVLVIRE
jgi:L-lactate dehydrogenase complex protein LldG